ncbi:MAG TPA: YdcF family protein [Pseudobacteroides sp.]|uniref:YdcF family protein n=1 Tax=Pseudobacteroides sp. TaxID=1968840 RepID=UPI002F9215FC
MGTNNFSFQCISDFIFAESKIYPSDIILVPGSDCMELAVRAAKLYASCMAPVILISGGANPLLPEYTSESEFLKNIAVSEGVQPEDIIMEDRARNTFENAVLSWNIIRQKGLNPLRCIMVCKAYHSRRALLTYQTRFPAGIEFFVSTVEDWKKINRQNWFQTDIGIETVMGEIVKIGEYFKGELKPLYEKENDYFSRV